jgi:regulator of protease activity HflC (stomatin/prohibitin superfamily)
MGGKKKYITRRLPDQGDDFFDGTAERIQNRIRDAIGHLTEEEQETVTFTHYYEESHYEDRYMVYEVRYESIETDKEYKDRLDSEARAKHAGQVSAQKRAEAKRKRELSLLKTLKSRYEH